MSFSFRDVFRHAFADQTTTGQFYKRLLEYCGPLGLRVNAWAGVTKRSLHTLEINTRPRSTVLQIHEWNNPETGFWGVTAERLGRIEETGAIWFVVLLLRTPHTGYLLSGEEIRRLSDSWSYAQGQYKIHEAELKPRYRFETFEDFIFRVPSLRTM